MNTQAFRTIVSTMIVAGIFLSAASAYAKEDSKENPIFVITPKLPEIILGPQPSAQQPPPSNPSPDTTTGNSSVTTPSDTQSSATTTPVATTTPTDSTNTASIPPKSAPRNGDEINPAVETILNQTLGLNPDGSTTTEKTVKTEKKKSVPAITIKKPALPSASTTASSTMGTTTASSTNKVLGFFNPTTDGDSNRFLPGNYYSPLDKLSPEATYGLSAIATILGIAGAILIIRDPQGRTVPEEEETWVPLGPQGATLRTQKPLLEP